MSIEDDISSLETVPTFRLLGIEAIRVLAIGSETRPVARGETLFRAGDTADAGYVVQQGALRVSAEDGGKHEIIAGPGTLVGELALIVEMKRPATVVAIEDTITIRISRSLFQKVLESDPAAARRLRDHLAERTGDAASAIMSTATRLG
jgi:CRP-like cAMP-binding protein